MSVFLIIIGLLTFWYGKNQTVNTKSIKTPISILLVALILLAAFSGYWSTYIVSSWSSIKLLLLGISVFFTTLILVSNKLISLKTIVASISLMACVVLIWSLFNLSEALSALGLSNINQLSIEQILATMGNKNTLSSFILLCLPFLALYAYYSKKHIRFALVFGFVLSILIIILLRTRSVWLAAIIMSATSMVVIWFKSRQIIQPKKVMGVGLLILFLGSSLVLSLKHHPQFKELTNTATLDTRIQLWKSTLKLITDNPIKGVGHGNWKIAIPPYLLPNIDASKTYYRDIAQAEVHFQRPHNDFLWVTAELGIIGGLIYLSLFVFLFYYCIRLVKNARNKDELIKFTSLLAFLIGYTVIANFSILLERPTHQLLFFIVAGIIVANYTMVFDDAKSRGISFRVFALVFLTIGVFTLYLSVDSLKNEKHVFKGLSARTSKNYEMAIKEFKSINIDRHNMDFAATPIAWYMGEYFALKGDFKTALSYYKIAEKAHPNHVYNLANMGVANYQLNNTELGINYIKKAVSIAPAFTEANLNLCAMYLKKDDFNTALFYFLNAYPNEKIERYLLINKIMFNQLIDEMLTQGVDQKHIKPLYLLKNKPKQLVILHYKLFNSDKNVKNTIIEFVSNK